MLASDCRPWAAGRPVGWGQKRLAAHISGAPDLLPELLVLGSSNLDVLLALAGGKRVGLESIFQQRPRLKLHARQQTVRCAHEHTAFETRAGRQGWAHRELAALGRGGLLGALRSVWFGCRLGALRSHRSSRLPSVAAVRYSCRWAPACAHVADNT